MKAAYIVIFSSMLAFPLTLALAERYGSRHCPEDMPCLPASIELSPAQQKALTGIYERTRHQQRALQQQASREVVNLLTPVQAEHLRARHVALAEPDPPLSPALR